ncbi:uncharacterized protein TNCT_735031 [Trichonephila clavata]|uniref:Uncharacterized protein n=1 Tax=Trichonephila clavata TaxID=2740835 RepID=A0A8X6K7U7_TRICU|nr:uncharacterized protein TNCT_735031 [Trichonephila clavata]
MSNEDGSETCLAYCLRSLKFLLLLFLTYGYYYALESHGFDLGEKIFITNLIVCAVNLVIFISRSYHLDYYHHKWIFLLLLHCYCRVLIFFGINVNGLQRHAAVSMFLKILTISDLTSTLGGLYIIYSWISRSVIRTAFPLFGYWTGLTYVNKECPRRTAVESFGRFIPGNDRRLFSAIRIPFSSLQFSTSLQNQVAYALLGLCYRLHSVLNYLCTMLQENEVELNGNPMKTKRPKRTAAKIKRTKLIGEKVKRLN